MRETIANLFGTHKYIISAVHFLPLPGSPGYDREGGVKKIVERAKRDAGILADNGVSGLLFTNEADTPYTSQLPLEATTTFAAVVQEVMHDLSIPFGINALMDVMSGLNIAHATDASYIRGLFSGCYVTDMGFFNNQGAAVFRARAALGTRKPYFFHNLSSILGPQLLPRTAKEEAESIIDHIEVDGFTLPATDKSVMDGVRDVIPNHSYVVGSGASFHNIVQLLESTDGAIVASCLHVDGKLLNPVDAGNTEKFMKLVRPVLGK